MHPSRAWERMRGAERTLPIVKDDEFLVGVVSTGDIAKSYMECMIVRYYQKARTQYRNIGQDTGRYNDNR